MKSIHIQLRVIEAKHNILAKASGIEFIVQKHVLGKIMNSPK